MDKSNDSRKRNASSILNPLNAELNPICHLLALLGGATIVVVSRLRVKDVVTYKRHHNHKYAVFAFVVFDVAAAAAAVSPAASMLCCCSCCFCLCCRLFLHLALYY